MINIFWTHNPISFKNMCLWCPLWEPLNTCVPLRQVTKLGPLSVHQKPSHAAIAILLCTCPWHGGEYNMRVMHIHWLVEVSVWTCSMTQRRFFQLMHNLYNVFLASLGSMCKLRPSQISHALVHSEVLKWRFHPLALASLGVRDNGIYKIVRGPIIVWVLVRSISSKIMQS